MGRLTTHIAAAFANVDNLPPTKDLQQVSFWDAFLPKSCSKPERKVAVKYEKTTPQHRSRHVSSCLEPQWCDVRHDFRGRKIIVAHKRSCYAGDKGGEGGKGETENPKQQEKKGGGGEGEGRKGKNGSGGGGEKEDKNGGDNNDGEKKQTATTTNDPPPQKLTKAQKKAARKEAAAAAAEPSPAKPNSKNPPSSAPKPSNLTLNNINTTAAAGGGDADGGGGGAAEYITLQEDALFSFAELRLLAELIAQYDSGRWGLVASRFFDKTGRRVHADDVREKFMGVWE